MIQEANAPREVLRLESKRGSLAPLWVEIRTAAGEIWMEAREMPRGGLLRYTRFRVLLPLRLELADRIGEQMYSLERSGGLAPLSYRLRQADGSLVLQLEPIGRRGWRLVDGSGLPVATGARHSILRLGTQTAHLDAPGGPTAAEIRWRPRHLFSTRWDGEILLFHAPERFRLPAVTLALVMLCGLQRH
jgi:hypothetical protein